LYTEKSIFLLF